MLDPAGLSSAPSTLLFTAVWRCRTGSCLSRVRWAKTVVQDLIAELQHDLRGDHPRTRHHRSKIFR